MHRIRVVFVLCVLGVAVAACSDDGGSGSATSGSADDAGTTTSTASGDHHGEVLLLSYNVAGLPQEISEVEPKEHIPMISPLLEDYELVLTQEDFDWWDPQIEALDFVNYHTRLRADVTHEYQSERHPGPEAVGIDVAADRPTMLVGDGLGFLSRLPFGEVVRVPWEGCFGGADTSDGGAGDCLAMKGFAVTTVELAPGVDVVVVNLHAEAGGTEADRRASHAGYQQMAAYLNEHHPDDPILFAGDTNLHTEEGRDPVVSAEGEAIASDREIWFEFLDATGITDACDVVECDEPGRIDKAAFRSSDDLEIEPLELTFEVEKFVDDEGDPLSDHDALAVRFGWSVPD